MRGPLHTFFLVLIICLVQFFTVATLKILDAGGNGGGTPGPSSGGLGDCVAGDINNDAAVNIADAIYVLSYLFTSGPEPVACAGNPTEVVVTGSADVNVINIPDVAVTGTADVNVTNTPTVNLAGPAEVTVSNTPTVNVGNIADVSIAGTASVQVANIPEVIVTNTADMNVVSIPPVEISSMPLVSDDFVQAMGQYFPRAGNLFASSFIQFPGDIALIDMLTVPDNKVFRLKAVNFENLNSNQYYWARIYIDGVDVTSELKAEYNGGNTVYRSGYTSVGHELLPGQTLSFRRYNTAYISYQVSINVQGEFLDYLP